MVPCRKRIGELSGVWKTQPLMQKRALMGRSLSPEGLLYGNIRISEKVGNV